MSEELFELKNYLYLGNFSTAITEGLTLAVDDEKCKIERDVILKRIDLAQGKYDSVISSITDASLPALQIVKLIAEFIKNDKTSDEVKLKLTEMVNDEVTIASPLCLLMASIAFTHIKDYDNALRTAHKNSSLEELSVSVQVLLYMDRSDMALKEIEKMNQMDEDNTLSQLSTAWVHIYNGGKDSMQEALYIYQDLLERHGATDSILNGIAVCHIGMGRCDEAEKVLKEALSKNPNCSTSLINVISCSAYKNKPAELIMRYFTQLGNVDGDNPWLDDHKRKENEFDKLAAQLTVS